MVINCLLTHDIAIRSAPNAPGITNKYMLVLSSSIPMANSSGPAVYSTLLMTGGRRDIAISVTHIEVTEPRKSQKLSTPMLITQYLYSAFLTPSQA